MKFLSSSALALVFSSASVHAQTNGEALRAELLKNYPSLHYVERYRQLFPDQVQGSEQLWRGTPIAALDHTSDLYGALAALQDQHVSLTGPGAGKSETLGIVLRTSTDNHVVVWRVIDPSVKGVKPGDVVLEVNGQPVAAWLARAATLTFGGNRRSRAAEAALKLGIGTPVDHASVGLGASIKLKVRGQRQATRALALPYLPMTGERAAALAKALNTRDLPPVIETGGYRVATIRFGAFAPQYEPEFDAAADAAEKLATQTAPPHGDMPDDGPMLAGFCAVVRKQLGEINAITRGTDALLIDLRGNFGGFGREARLMARALMSHPLPKSFDVLRGSTPGNLKLVAQPDDPACGGIVAPRRMIVWIDAGTRSSGELMAAWLWAAGAVVAGERTIGAGGGLDADAAGFALPHLGYRVRSSGNFTFFDMGDTLHAGETGESALVELVSNDRFAPSRTRPFALQAAGLRPDLSLPSGEADLQDGGLAAAKHIIAELARRGLFAGGSPSIRADHDPSL